MAIWMKPSVIVVLTAVMIGCSGSNNPVESNQTELSENVFKEEQEDRLSAELRSAIEHHYVDGPSAVRLPESDDFEAIPHDPNNPITAAKVELGKALYHDTGFATKGQSNESLSWSCASCHHAAAGFKSGIPQGIGEGGTGFGEKGSARRLADGFDGSAAADAANKPDIQPFTSPAVLNVAYQDVMLWNGQFGNSQNGVINNELSESVLSPEGTPMAENSRGLSGIETQAIAGMEVHRIEFDRSSMLQTDNDYRWLYLAAYGDERSEMKVDAGKAIAAYERTILANQAPFQRWLQGEKNALNEAEKRGGALFFGKAQCADCHRGPALSSEEGATAEAVFMAVGFGDFEPEKNERIHGLVTDADRLGRGGFTTNPSDNFKFKIPQLYNLADTTVFGHGASFDSIRAVLEYKNWGIPQKDIGDQIDQRFKPLNLTSAELDDLEHFLKTGLYDPNLMRYQPTWVPSGECLIVDPLTVDTQSLCPDGESK